MTKHKSRKSTKRKKDDTVHSPAQMVPAQPARPVPTKLIEPPRAVAAAPDLRAGRTIIEAVTPLVDNGVTTIKRVVGDVLVIEANVFTDGHEQIGVDAMLREAQSGTWQRVPMVALGNDRYRATIPLSQIGHFAYAVEAWRDPFVSWATDTRKKVAAGQDVTTELNEGRGLVGPSGVKLMIEELLGDVLIARMREEGPRHDVSRSAELPLLVERLRARFSSWYELFPRSQSRVAGQHGTFRDVQERLPEIRAMGFDVLYFTPIHPIGVKNRKGRNNSLTAQPGDPGSVYAIGGKEGGHTALHPELGGIDDFRSMVSAARASGLEIALDFAVQCSPDHPWIREHPEWFEWRPDGTIKYAENPPKKYEDIVNVRFDGPAYPGVWHALRDAFLYWVNEGVTIFRVDNPHTKPVPFWQWLIAEVNAKNPDVIFLAEAFTRPAMMRKLAKAGFQQSYTYFTWRNTKWELETYITELAGEMAEYYRPNFFVNTPDINPVYLQTSGPAGFVVRATLAATLSSTWGLYSGFEWCEYKPLSGKEEYLDSEKYEIKHRRSDTGTDIRAHITALNTIRNANPALQDFRNCLFVKAWNDSILAYARMTPARDNCVFVAVNLDPHNVQEAHFEIPLWEFGLPDDASIEVEDLLLGLRFTLTGKSHWIRLDPNHRTCVIWRLKPPQVAGRAA